MIVEMTITTACGVFWRRQLLDDDKSISVNRTVVFSGVLDAPCGPECFGDDNLASEGSTIMRKKKTVRSRTILKMQNMQEIHVTVDSKRPLTTKEDAAD